MVGTVVCRWRYAVLKTIDVVSVVPRSQGMLMSMLSLLLTPLGLDHEFLLEGLIRAQHPDAFECYPAESQGFLHSPHRKLRTFILPLETMNCCDSAPLPETFELTCRDRLPVVSLAESHLVPPAMGCRTSVHASDLLHVGLSSLHHSAHPFRQRQEDTAR